MNEETVADVIKKALGEAEQAKTDLERSEKKKRAMELYSQYSKADKLISSHDLLKEVQARPEVKKFPTGYKKLDEILDGFREQQLVIISAQRKSGKTSFAMNLSQNMLQFNPVWFPYEQSAEELVTIAHELKRDVPFFYVPASNETDRTKLIKWMECRIVEAIAKYDSKVFFIDHLHYIINPTDNGLTHQIRLATQELKRIAKKWKVVIVLLAHVNKNAKQTDEPTTDDISDSASVAQEADIVIMLWRKSEKQDNHLVYFNEMTANVQANRRTGKTGVSYFIYDDTTGKYNENDGVNDFNS